MAAIGVEVRGGGARLLVWDREGGVIDARRILADADPASVGAAAAILAGRAACTPAAIAVACGDGGHGEAWVAGLARATGLPVRAIGRGAALATALRCAGVLPRVPLCAAIDVGAELALGVLAGSRPLLPQGRDPRIGHVSLDPRGPLCACGARGCVDAILGAAGLAAAGRIAALPADRDSAAYGIAARADDRDPIARAVLAEAADALARVVSAVDALFRPGAIAVVWPGARPDGVVAALVRARVGRWANDVAGLRFAAADADAVARGAAIWAGRGAPARSNPPPASQHGDRT